ncbi:unnamed protein product [Camellia sinensis]
MLVADFGPKITIKIAESLRDDIYAGKLKSGSEIKDALKNCVLDLVDGLLRICLNLHIHFTFLKGPCRWPIVQLPCLSNVLACHNIPISRFRLYPTVILYD